MWAHTRAQIKDPERVTSVSMLQPYFLFCLFVTSSGSLICGGARVRRPPITVGGMISPSQLFAPELFSVWILGLGVFFLSRNSALEMGCTYPLRFLSQISYLLLLAGVPGGVFFFFFHDLGELALGQIWMEWGMGGLVDPVSDANIVFDECVMLSHSRIFVMPCVGASFHIWYGDCGVLCKPGRWRRRCGGE